MPDKVYYQVDGGSENTAKAVLAICFLIVARGLTKKFVITRLIVGHTHEDIDALFGKIWEYIKEEMALTPQAYERLILKALSKPNRPVKVVDIFAVPDYKSLLEQLH